MHSALNKWRINPRNEIFDLSSEEARQVYMKIKAFIIEIVNLSGLPKPIERTINYPYWLAARKAAKVGRKWNRKFNEIEDKRKKQILKEEKKQKKIKLAQEKKNCVEYKPTNVKKQKPQNIKDDKIVRVNSYINNNLIYTGNNNDYVSRIPMYNAFNKLFIEQSNKKTALGKVKFFEKVKELLGIDNYRADLKRKTRCKDAFLKWKMK